MFGSIETPRLVLDKGILQRNASHFLRHAEDGGVVLRPHLKTSKSIDVARIATGGRLSTVTVSTLKEAGYFAENGFTDILYAVGITPNKFPHVKRIIDDTGADLLLITDNTDVARAAAAFADAEDCPLKFLIEVDSGEHRGGVTADGSVLPEIARALSASPRVSVKGVMTHAGHSYAFDEPARIREVAETERSTAVAAAGRLADAGTPCEIVSVGSTPTFLFAESFDGVTEVRSGVYLFHDLTQFSRHVCRQEDIALSVLSTVIGHNRQGRYLVLDAGALALSKDIGANTHLPDAGYGYVCDPVTLGRYGDLSIDIVHQEHGSVPVSDDTWFDRLPVGSLVRILPNHACMTAAAYPDYLVVDDGEIMGEWPRINGW